MREARPTDPTSKDSLSVAGARRLAGRRRVVHSWAVTAWAVTALFCATVSATPIQADTASDPQFKLLAPTPYEATYQARSHGMRTDAYRYLRTEDHEVFEVSHGLSVSMLGANLISVEETSQFRWQDRGAIPLWYTYDQGGVRRRHEHITFDWSTDTAHVETGRGEYQTAIFPGALDNLSFSAQMSAELHSRRSRGEEPMAVDQVLTFQIVDGDEIDEHIYRIASYETIDTLMGELNTVKLERVRDPESRRSTEIWLAPAYEFVLARLVQTESGGSRTELVLKSFAQTLPLATAD